MGIAKLLSSSLEYTVEDDKGKWRQFVLDHLDYISARSTTFSISPELMNKYRYDLRRYLKSELNRHQDIGWIVQLLNNLRNDFQFVDITNLIVPDDSLITQLYFQYTTVTKNAR